MVERDEFCTVFEYLGRVQSEFIDFTTVKVKFIQEVSKTSSGKPVSSETRNSPELSSLVAAF